MGEGSEEKRHEVSRGEESGEGGFGWRRERRRKGKEVRREMRKSGEGGS